MQRKNGHKDSIFTAVFSLVLVLIGFEPATLQNSTDLQNRIYIYDHFLNEYFRNYVVEKNNFQKMSLLDLWGDFWYNDYDIIKLRRSICNLKNN